MTNKKLYSGPRRDVVKIFWTGGWDSTFQLLRLLLVHKVPVETFYLIDEGRNSTAAELKAMDQIRKYLFKEYTHTDELFKPVQYFDVSDIPQYESITEAYNNISENKHIGSQYMWLAGFCEYKSISNIQLCLVKHPVNYSNHFSLIGSVEKFKEGSMLNYKIAEKYKGSDEYILFKYFSIPTINLSKIEMKKIAFENGWGNIMKQTWFCHHPRKMKPCGICNPCLIAIDDNVSFRIPLKSRAISLFYKKSPQRIKKKIKKMYYQ